MSKRRIFLTRAGSTSKFGLLYEGEGERLAITVGGVTKEARAGEKSHSDIALRVIQSGELGPYREGYTYSEDEVPA